MPRFIEVDDPADPRVAGFRDVRDRDLQGRAGLFMAEGEVVLRAMVAAARFEVEAVLIAAKRATALADVLAALPPSTPVHLAAPSVLDAIAGFPLHRGVLALGRRRPAESPDALLAACGASACVLVLFGIGNHDNMGALFRNAAAFGAQGVLLDPTCCDPLYRKAIRVSVGAALRVPYARLAAGEDALDLLMRHGFEALALSPAGLEPLHRLAPPGRPVLLLGAEGPGLPPETLARARTVSIPMAAGFDSLNVATAAAIALHHLAAPR